MKKLVVMLAMLVTPAAAQQSQPSKEDVREAATSHSYTSFAGIDEQQWRRDARAALTRMTPDAAADWLAAKYGFAAADMRKLLRVWIVAKSRQFAPDRGWTAGLRRDVVALVPSVRGKPVGLAILAEALDATREDCTADDFQALMAGSASPVTDAYVIATNAGCTGNFARAAALSGPRAMPALIRVAEWGGLPPRDVLPLYAWLTSPAALDHIGESDRPAVATLLWQRYLTALFAAGMDARALALFDGLPPELRAAIVSPLPRRRLVATVDRIGMTFAPEDDSDDDMTAAMTSKTEALSDQADALADQADALMGQAGAKAPKIVASPSSPAKPQPRDLSSIDAPILQLAEAMAGAGRDDEARRLLASLPGLAEARAALTCAYAETPQSKAPCADGRKLPMGALPLDHLLNDPGSDPYPIAETTLSGMGDVGRSASDAILCRVFPEQDYPGVCPAGRDDAYFDDTSSGAEELVEAEAALERAIPTFGALRTSIVGVRDTRPTDRRASRKTVAAIPPDYAEKPVPAADAGTAPGAAVKGLAPLPPGFELVRAERAGQRVVAISVSQTYDPTGEVSRGGYWVHVSDDGGRHWQKPLYTGLADRFPYVVQPASRLPLIAGDALHLAVDIAEIDTASITYPPVGLRSRRRIKDLYLTISLADLRRDSDGDGITDIAAHHLLLDRPRASGTRPFIVGSDYDADCRIAPTPEKLALIDLIGRVTGGSSAAIVEPVDRPSGQFATGWQRATATDDQPIFLIGRREDYACLASKRLIIVYSQAQIEAMAPFTPDFRALEMPRIVFNRARDRGYVRWSTGWAGGTYRLRRVGGKWQFDTVSSWIS